MMRLLSSVPVIAVGTPETINPGSVSWSGEKSETVGYRLAAARWDSDPFSNHSVAGRRREPPPRSANAGCGRADLTGGAVDLDGTLTPSMVKTVQTWSPLKG